MNKKSWASWPFNFRAHINRFCFLPPNILYQFPRKWLPINPAAHGSWNHDRRNIRSSASRLDRNGWNPCRGLYCSPFVRSIAWRVSSRLRILAGQDSPKPTTEHSQEDSIALTPKHVILRPNFYFIKGKTSMFNSQTLACVSLAYDEWLSSSFLRKSNTISNTSKVYVIENVHRHLSKKQ